jgi:hypothetical protein
MPGSGLVSDHHGVLQEDDVPLAAEQHWFCLQQLLSSFKVAHQ